MKFSFTEKKIVISDLNMYELNSNKNSSWIEGNKMEYDDDRHLTNQWDFLVIKTDCSSF